MGSCISKKNKESECSEAPIENEVIEVENDDLDLDNMSVREASEFNANKALTMRFPTRDRGSIVIKSTGEMYVERDENSHDSDYDTSSDEPIDVQSSEIQHNPNIIMPITPRYVAVS